MINYSLFGYALATSLVLIFGWVIYRILFEVKVNPAINRKVLLSVYGLSLLIPAISPLFQFSRPDTNIEVGMITFENMPDIPTEIVFQDSGYFPILLLLTKVYFIGVIVMISITYISIYKLLRLKKKAGKIKINGLNGYIHDNKNLASFSWFKTIFLYENALSHDTHILLEHEKAHINSYHWVDLLITQIFLIVQWFNPVAWMMRKELQQVHEYQADEKVLEKGYEEKFYKMFLLRNITNARYPSFSNGFNNCSIKKRILMMNRKNFKNNLCFRFLILATGLILCGSLLHIPVVASVMEINSPEKNKEEIKVFGLSSLEKNNPLAFNHGMALGNDIGIVKKPTYEGGDQKLRRDLGRRLRYPYEAYEKNIQGTVIVEFTVTKTGDLKNFRIEKSINIDLDVAAVNAIKDLPGRWNPGEINGINYDLTYSLPISFKI